MIRLLRCFGIVFALALGVMVYRGVAAQAAAATLIAYWHLDEATGSTYADAINNHDGTCTNCPTATPGQRSGAQLFDGSSNEVNVPADPAFDWDANDSFAIELWVQALPNQTCTSDVTLIGRGDGSGTQRWVVGCSGGSGRVTFALSDGSSTVQLQSTRVITDGLWHHVAAGRDGATDHNWLTVDGTDVVSSTHSFNGSLAPAAAAIHLGHYHNGAYFGGTLDEVALYNGSLTPNDIMSHYYLVRNYDVVCDTPIRLMPLGDSITSGYGSGDFPTTPGYNIGYRRPLYLTLTGNEYDMDFVGGMQHGQLASGPPFDYTHEGHPGWFDEQLAPQVINFLTVNPADVILLHIGTNDVASGQGPGVTHVAQILANIDTFDAAIPVIVAKIIDQNPNHPLYAPGAVAAFNANLEAMVLNRMAAGDKLLLVDQENALDYDTDMFSDRLHPNNLGYTKMATVWFDALLPFLPLCITPTAITLTGLYVEPGNASPPAIVGILSGFALITVILRRTKHW